jgi:hypothetical protein
MNNGENNIVTAIVKKQNMLMPLKVEVLMV